MFKQKQEKQKTENVYYFSGGHQLWNLYKCKIMSDTQRMINEFDEAFSKSQRLGTYRDLKDKIQIAFLRDDESEARRLLGNSTIVERERMK